MDANKIISCKSNLYIYKPKLDRKLVNICMLRVDEIRFRKLVIVKKECLSGFDSKVFKRFL